MGYPKLGSTSIEKGANKFLLKNKGPDSQTVPEYSKILVKVERGVYLNPLSWINLGTMDSQPTAMK